MLWNGLELSCREEGSEANVDRPKGIYVSWLGPYHVLILVVKDTFLIATMYYSHFSSMSRCGSISQPFRLLRTSCTLLMTPRYFGSWVTGPWKGWELLNWRTRFFERKKRRWKRRVALRRMLHSFANSFNWREATNFLKTERKLNYIFWTAIQDTSTHKIASCNK